MGREVGFRVEGGGAVVDQDWDLTPLHFRSGFGSRVSVSVSGFRVSDFELVVCGLWFGFIHLGEGVYGGLGGATRGEASGVRVSDEGSVYLVFSAWV